MNVNHGQRYASDIIEIVDDSDSDEINDDSNNEVVLLFSRRPLASKPKEIEVVDLASSDDDEVECVPAAKPPSSRVNRLSPTKKREPPCNWVGQSMAKKVKLGGSNQHDGVAMHEVTVPRYVSIRNDSNEARPLKKSGISRTALSNELPTSALPCNPLNSNSSAKPKSILRTSKGVKSNPYQSSIMMTNQQTQYSGEHMASQYSVPAHDVRASSKHLLVKPFVNLDGKIRPPTPPVTYPQMRGNENNDRLLPKPKSPHANPPNQNLPTSRSEIDSQRIVRQKSLSISPRNNCGTKRTHTDDFKESVMPESECSPCCNEPESDCTIRPPISLPLVNRLTEPSENDLIPREQASLVEDEKGKVRPSTPPLLNCCIQDVDDDNLLVNPSSLHSDLDSLTEVTDTKQTPTPDANTNYIPPSTHENSYDCKVNTMPELECSPCCNEPESDCTIRPPVSLPLVNRLTEPSENDLNPREQASLIEDEKGKGRPSTPPLLNCCIQDVDDDNLLFYPSSSHSNLDSLTEVTITNRTPTPDANSKYIIAPSTHENSCDCKVNVMPELECNPRKEPESDCTIRPPVTLPLVNRLTEPSDNDLIPREQASLVEDQNRKERPSTPLLLNCCIQDVADDNLLFNPSSLHSDVDSLTEEVTNTNLTPTPDANTNYIPLSKHENSYDYKLYAMPELECNPCKEPESDCTIRPPVTLPLVKHSSEPSDDDLIPRVQASLFKDEKRKERPSTPQLLNCCIQDVDDDNLLFNPSSLHSDLDSLTEVVTSANLTPTPNANTNYEPPSTHENSYDCKLDVMPELECNPCKEPESDCTIQPPVSLPLVNRLTEPTDNYLIPREQASLVEDEKGKEQPSTPPLLNCCIQDVTDDNLLFNPSSSHSDLDSLTEVVTSTNRTPTPNANTNYIPPSTHENNDSGESMESDNKVPIRPLTPPELNLQSRSTDVNNVQRKPLSVHLDLTTAANSDSAAVLPKNLPHMVNDTPSTSEVTERDDPFSNSIPIDDNRVQHECDETRALRAETPPQVLTQIQCSDADGLSKSPTSVHLDLNLIPDSICEVRTSPLVRRRSERTDDDDDDDDDDDNSPLGRVSVQDNEVPREQKPLGKDDTTLQTGTSPLTQNEIHPTDIDNISSYLSSLHLDTSTARDSDNATLPASKLALGTIWSNADTSFQSSSPEQIAIDDLERDLPASMVIVPHLSRKSVNQATKLPIWEFSVYGEDDSIIYSFKAFTAKSKVRGAGLGAFLEFMGVKRLSKSSNERRLRLLYQLDEYESITMQPLQAYPKKGGSGVTVFLKGKDLHGNGNRDFQLKQLKAVISKDSWYKKGLIKKKSEQLTVKLVSEEDLQLNIEYDANYIDDNSLLNPIGHLKVQTDCDYYIDCSVTRYFSSLNCIDLGRYGPFQMTDRKAEDFFVLKSFIFSNIPAEWSFGTLENLHGMQQIIDITDDITGTPSDLARKEIPMYVNEVGYNNNYIQNVYIKDSDDERSVRYFFMPDTPMEKGVPVELLTNYRSAYELVRERKGYGRNNAEHDLKSDSCRATCLQRNFVEREDIQNILNECSSVPWLRHLLQSIYTRIYCPILEFLRKGLEINSLQWVALLRIRWIINVFRQQVNNKKGVLMEKKLNASTKERKLNEMERTLNEMEKTVVKEVLPVLRIHPHLTEMRSDINFELLEEICFPVRLYIPHILDDARYCPAVVRFTELLCKAIADVYILKEPEQRNNLLPELHNKIMEYLPQAKSEILQQNNVMELTQIAVIIDAFASIYMKKSAYSMRNVCIALGLDYEHAKSATKSQLQFVDQPTAVKSTKPCARKDGKQTRPDYVSAELVYFGPPTIPFPGNGNQWPDGWTQKSYKRASGATKGRIDVYWFPPKGVPKLRSRVEVRGYLARQAK